MKIESYQQACQVLGHDPEAIRPDLSKVPEKYREAQMATFEMYIICEASWEGKEPNWNDYNEYKWTPWFDMRDDEDNPSGFRFYGSVYDHMYSGSTGGSRHCYRSEDESDYHAKQHIEKYRAMIVLPG